ncbi:MAG: hypothetical protein JXM69_03230 [Anaerolineae bacterium]|nr:hypothetical protein [Anaerolineae bacterium]
MRRLRLWTTVLIIWLIFLFNIERINSPINIRAYTYVFVAIVAVITLLLPKLRWLPYWSLMIVCILAFLLYKAFWDHRPLWGTALPLTVTQMSVVVLTGLISRQINSGLREFEDVIGNITFGRIGNLPKPFAEMQGEIYKEVRRARRYQRPLSVVSLKIDEASMRAALPNMIKSVQQAMMREYVFANVTRILDDNMDDFGSITLRDDHFILVLPEKTTNEAAQIARNLSRIIQEEMKVELQTGLANFPDEAITFETLIEQAVKSIGQKIGESERKSIMEQQPKQEIVPQEG